MRTRAELRAHLHTTTRQYPLPARGTKSADKAHRDGGAERCPAPAVPQSIAGDRARMGHYDQRLRDVALSLLTTATPQKAPPLDGLRTVPGLGESLSGVLLSESPDSTRFPRVPDVLAACRLGTCTQASAGQRYGTAGPQVGNAHRTGACSEAAGLFLRAHPAGHKARTTREHTPGSGTALPRLGQTLGRPVSAMFQRPSAVAMGKLLTGSGSGADEPNASRDHHGLRRRVVLCQAGVAASWNA